MKLYFKIKFGAEIDKIESFGGNRFLVYMTMKKDDPNVMALFINALSRKFGVEQKHIKYLGKNGEGPMEEHIFEI